MEKDTKTNWCEDCKVSHRSRCPWNIKIKECPKPELPEGLRVKKNNPNNRETQLNPKVVKGLKPTSFAST